MSNHNENPPYIVCPTCKGEGTHGPGFVHTQDNLADLFGDDWDARMEYLSDLREGRYNVTCTECGGKRVVRGDCPCMDCEQGRYEIAEMEAMERAERAFGC